MIRTLVALALLAPAFVGASPAHAECTPWSSSVTPGALTWTVWQNPNTAAVAFEWHGSGLAVVSDDCASRLDVTVEVTDYATVGSPYAVAGMPGHGHDTTASDGEFRAFAGADDFVVYYDPLGLSVRGPSEVEVKVTASYFDTETLATRLLGCTTTRTSVTPLPIGPLVSTGPAEACP